MADGIFDEDNAGLAGAGHEQTHQKMAAESKRGSKKMVTVMASRIIEDRLLKVRLGK